jgi:tetratricopeptide (TPR) repeat protein
MRLLSCVLVLFVASHATQAGDSRPPTPEDLAKARQVFDLCAGENDTPSEVAIEACSEVLAREPAEGRWDKLRVLRGGAFLDLQLYDEAIGDFSAVLSRTPAEWDALALRAVAYSSKGEPKPALADIQQAVKLQPDSTSVQYLAGFIHELNNDLDGAIASFSIVLRLKPAMRDALYARGALYERTGQNDKALADYAAMVRLDPNDVLARHSRGALYAQLGRDKEARTDFAAATHIESRSAKTERMATTTPSLDGEVYVRPCELPDGSYAPAAWVPRDPAKPATFNYYESHTDPETGFCIKEILAKHPNATRENAVAQRRKQQDEARQRKAAQTRALAPWDAVDGFGTGPYASDRSAANAERNGSAPATAPRIAAPMPGVTAPAPYGPAYEPLKPPKYIPYEPRAVTSTAEPRRRTVSPDSMDTRYNPYETIDEARHGRGRRYDPYATRDSWEVDRSNPYAVAPAYKYRGIYNPFSGSATPYNPPTTLGGGYEPNNWQTNRYNPFGTRRSSPVISGDNRAPLSPLNPPSNCPNKSTNPLNPYAPRSC